MVPGPCRDPRLFCLHGPPGHLHPRAPITPPTQDRHFLTWVRRGTLPVPEYRRRSARASPFPRQTLWGPGSQLPGPCHFTAATAACAVSPGASSKSAARGPRDRCPHPSVTRGTGAHPPPVAGTTLGRVPCYPGIPGRGTGMCQGSEGQKGSLRQPARRWGQRERLGGRSGSCALAGGTGEPPFQAGEAEVRALVQPLDL